MSTRVIIVLIMLCSFATSGTITQNNITKEDTRKKPHLSQYIQILETTGILVRDRNNNHKLIENYENHPNFKTLPQELQELLLPDNTSTNRTEFKDSKGNVYKVEYYARDQRRNKYRAKEQLLLSSDTIYEKTFSPEGMLIQEGLLIRSSGLKQGDWKTYTQNGRLLNIINYDNGLETTANREITAVPETTPPIVKVVDRYADQTIYHYYIKGTLAPTGNWEYFVSYNNNLYLQKTELYSNGQKVKEVDYFIPEGTKQKEQTFKNNLLDGLIYSYDRSGNIISSENYKSDIPYYNNGIPTYTNIPVSKNNQAFLQHIELFPDGTTRSIGYINSKGSQGEYLEYILTSTNMLEISTSAFYIDNIRVVSIEHTGEALTIGGYAGNGQAQGLWLKYFKSTNKLSTIGYYENGIITIPANQISIVPQKNETISLYTTSGNILLLTANIKNNALNGWWGYYSPQTPNKLIKQCYFDNSRCTQVKINPK